MSKAKKSPSEKVSERTTFDSLGRRSYQQNDQVNPQEHEDPDLETAPYSRPYGPADSAAKNDAEENGEKPPAPDTPRDQQASREKVATRKDDQQTRKIYGGEALPEFDKTQNKNQKKN